MTPAASAAAMTGRTPSARNSGLASAVAAAVGGRDVLGRRSGRAGRPSPRAPRRPGRSRRRSSASRRRPSSSVRPDEATPTRLPTHEAQVDDDVRLGHVLVDLAVGEAGQRGVLGHDEGLGLGRARRASRMRRARPRPGERVVGAVVVHRAIRRLTTCRRRPGRRGSGRPARRGRRGRSGPARPCRSSACRASRSSARRRPRRTSARTRR